MSDNGHKQRCRPKAAFREAVGWPGLVARYHRDVAAPPKTMDLGLTYKALASGQIDLIAGNSTDGLIESLGLVALAAPQLRGRRQEARRCGGGEGLPQRLGRWRKGLKST